MARLLSFPIVLAFALAPTGCGSSEGASDTTSTGSESAGTTGAEGDGEAASSGGAETPPAAPARVSGRNFSVPLPSGFAQKVSGTIADMMRRDVLEPGGVILMADASAVAGAVPGSIVVSPTVTDISSDAVDENLCGQLAEIVAGRENATVDRSGMITLPWGRTCQWELVTARDENRRRIGTVFAANAEDWIVTCNFDSRDDAAREACTRVLSGWAFH